MDPILVKVDSLSKVLSDPQALNSYAYSRNNPIVLVDKDGNFYVPFLSNYINKVVGDAIGKWIVSNPKQSAEIGLGFVPVVGEANDLTETIRGRETITGKELNTSERLITGGATLLPFVGGKVAREALNKSDEIVTLYHGTGHNATEILKDGFSTIRDLFMTDSRKLADAYRDGWIGEGLDQITIGVNMPRRTFNELWKSGDIFPDPHGFTDPTFPGAHQFGFTDKAKEVINQYLDKLFK